MVHIHWACHIQCVLGNPFSINLSLPFMKFIALILKDNTVTTLWSDIYFIDIWCHCFSLNLIDRNFGCALSDRKCVCLSVIHSLLYADFKIKSQRMADMILFCNFFHFSCSYSIFCPMQRRVHVRLANNINLIPTVEIPNNEEIMNKAVWLSRFAI